MAFRGCRIEGNGAQNNTHTGTHNPLFIKHLRVHKRLQAADSLSMT
jgi:hypothetical protein